MEYAALVITPLVAVFVGWLGFRYAIAQDTRRFAFERRAELYVDLLVEASAEVDQFKREMAAKRMGQPMPVTTASDQMDKVERRRLAARATAYGSGEVARRWNTMIYYEMNGTFPGSDPTTFSTNAELAFRDLERQINLELSREQLSWLGALRTPRTARADAEPKEMVWP